MTTDTTYTITFGTRGTGVSVAVTETDVQSVTVTRYDGWGITDEVLVSGIHCRDFANTLVDTMLAARS